MTKKILLLLATVSSVTYSAYAQMNFGSYSDNLLTVTSNLYYDGTRSETATNSNDTKWPFVNPNTGSAQSSATYYFSFKPNVTPTTLTKLLVGGSTNNLAFGMALDGVYMDAVPDECWNSASDSTDGTLNTSANMPSKYNYVYNNASSCSYRFEGVWSDGTRILGIDTFNGHAKSGGVYHYHTNPLKPKSGTYAFNSNSTDKFSLISAKNSSGTTLGSVSLVGFSSPCSNSSASSCRVSYPVLYSSSITSSYSLSSSRSGGLSTSVVALGGFDSDYTYTSSTSANALDKANGMQGTFTIKINGTNIAFKYAYFVTDNYPYIPRYIKN